MPLNVLSIKDLTVTVGESKILDGVSLEIPAGKIVGIVGGSGSGKTTLGLSILQLLPDAMRRPNGHILLDGQDLTQLNNTQMRAIRGKDIGMVFQEPLSAFDPLFTIGQQIDETLAAHTDLNPAARRQRSLEVLRRVELSDPGRIYSCYPHQLSGGLRQRAMIAQAIACDPKLIIADEPTSSLDVTTQTKIIQLLHQLNQQQGMAMILISHDLSMVANLATQIVVMNEGKVVEAGTAVEILKHPRHVYTKALVDASEYAV